MKTNFFDEARAIEGMIKTRGISQGDMAKRLGVSQSYIANKLRLLRLDKKTQEEIISEGLSERHARALLRLKDEAARKSALAKICRDRLNVQESEALVDFLYDTEAPSRIGRASMLSRIDTFKSTLEKSLATLSSLGIDATKSTNYYGSKTYITICIDEG